jgi:hypothetical protein
MRALIVAFAMMSFVAASTLPDLAQAQTPAGTLKPAGAPKQAAKHRKVKKVQFQSPAPAAPTLIYEDRGGPKMGM